MKKFIVLLYITVATLLFGYAKAEGNDTRPNPAYDLKKSNTVIEFPVQLESVTVKFIGDKAEISWSTLAEKNSKQFEVQRSTDGENYKTIAIVFTLEDSNEIKHYSFKEELKGVKTKKLLYRIKLVDTVEGYTYSKTVTPA